MSVVEQIPAGQAQAPQGGDPFVVGHWQPQGGGQQDPQPQSLDSQDHWQQQQLQQQQQAWRNEPGNFFLKGFFFTNLFILPFFFFPL